MSRFLKLTAILLSVLYLAAFLGCGGDKEWYEEGELYEGTLAEWKEGSEGDKLATAAKFAFISFDVIDRVRGMKELGSDTGAELIIKTARPHAEDMVECIDGYAEPGSAAANAAETVIDAAALCSVLLGWPQN